MYISSHLGEILLSEPSIIILEDSTNCFTILENKMIVMGGRDGNLKMLDLKNKTIQD